MQDTFIRQDGTVSALGAQYSNNTRDQDFSPASGGLHSGSFEFGVANTTTVGNSPSPLAPGRHNVNKLGIDLRQYFSLQGPRKLGDIKSAEAGLRRASAARIFQPRRAVLRAILPGRSRLAARLGYGPLLGQQPGTGTGRAAHSGRQKRQLSGCALDDVGDAWGSIYQGQGLAQHRQLSLQSDYGVGIRLVTPIGPIRVDYAMGRGGGKTQFSIGQSF